MFLDVARDVADGRLPGHEERAPGSYEPLPYAEKQYRQYRGVTYKVGDDEDHEAGEGHQEAGAGHPEYGEVHYDAGAGHHEADPGHHDAGAGHHDAGAGHHDAGAGHHDVGEGHHDAGEGHHEAHGAGDGHGHTEAMVSANCLAVGMVAVVAISPVVLHMALQPGMHGYLTVKLIDTFMSIFISILWYEVFDQAMVTFDVEGKYGFNLMQIFEFVCVIIAYGIAVGLASFLQDNEVYLNTYAGIGAHYVAFAIIGTGGHVQAAVSGRGVWASFLFVVLIVVGVSSYGAMIEQHVSTQGKSLRKAVEEMEVDIIALVSAFLLTQCVRQCITGSHPGMSHLQLATEDIHAPVEHAEWQRLFMLCWSVALTIFSVFVVPRLSEGFHGQRKARKLVHAFKALVIMLVAWGYLLWGEWVFFEEIFKGSEMYGHMLFAMVATGIGLAVLWLFAAAAEQGREHMTDLTSGAPQFIQHISQDISEALDTESFRRTCNISVTGISLVIAWSWEHCFSMAFDIIGTHYEVGYSGLIPKLFLAVVIPCFLLPSYVLHIKPRVLNGTKGSASNSESEVGEDACPADQLGNLTTAES